jgi:hypothetical protein
LGCYSIALALPKLIEITIETPKVAENDTYYTFEVYELNNFQRPLLSGITNFALPVQPGRYNIRVIEESPRGLREIWFHDLKINNHKTIKAQFPSPTVRVQLLTQSIVKPKIVFQTPSQEFILLPGSYHRLPVGQYAIRVYTEDLLIETRAVDLKRETVMILKSDGSLSIT